MNPKHLSAADYMKGEQMEGRCDRCEYYIPVCPYPNGRCVRYPKEENVYANTWCGEFKPKGSEASDGD